MVPPSIVMDARLPGDDLTDHDAIGFAGLQQRG